MSGGGNWMAPNAVGGPIVSSGPPQPFFRDQLDEVRSMWRRTPDAMYPDGYLGTITSRRGDRVLDQLKNNLNKRNYQRGVHVGERINQGDYFWSPQMNPMSGLEAQAKGQRWQIVADHEPVTLINDGKAARPGAASLMNLPDARRASQLDRLRPQWR